MVKVFYNKSCKICNTEINHYKKHSTSNISWIDIVDNKKAQQLTSKSYEQLIRRIHVIVNGKTIEGAQAFLVIWKNIPKYRILYRIFNNKPMFLILHLLYELLAFLLFIKNKNLLNK